MSEPDPSSHGAWDCEICWHEISSERPAKVLPCGHKLCLGCAFAIFENGRGASARHGSNLCPFCRSQLDWSAHPPRSLPDWSPPGPTALRSFPLASLDTAPPAAGPAAGGPAGCAAGGGWVSRLFAGAQMGLAAAARVWQRAPLLPHTPAALAVGAGLAAQAAPPGALLAAGQLLRGLCTGAPAGLWRAVSSALWPLVRAVLIFTLAAVAVLAVVTIVVVAVAGYHLCRALDALATWAEGKRSPPPRREASVALAAASTATTAAAPAGGSQAARGRGASRGPATGQTGDAGAGAPAGHAAALAARGEGRRKKGLGLLVRACFL